MALTEREAHGVIRRLISDSTLIGWTFKFNNNAQRVGVCKHEEKTLEFSRRYLCVMTMDNLIEVATHEIAHAVLGVGYGHGITWQRTHRAMGGTGRRAAPVTLPKDQKKWVISCPTDGRELGRVNRKGHRLANAYCKCCRQPAAWTQLR